MKQDRSHAWLRTLRNGRCELSVRAGDASLRMFSSRETCLKYFDFFKTIHGVELPLDDKSSNEIEGQTSILDFVA
jgi:hypothetical protein